MKKILIVQAQHCLYHTLALQITAVTGMEVDVAESLADAQEMKKSHTYLMMLLDIDMHGENEESMEVFIVKQQLPVILMANQLMEDSTLHFQRTLVVDYVIKESPESIMHIVKSVNRIFRNQNTKVLVVDDSASDRRYISLMIKNQLYQVCEAADGQAAIEMLERDPKIKIIVADVHMPKVDGIELLKYIRERKLQKELAILGVSADQESLIRFIKLGANDFVTKPFSKREFIARLNHLADVYEQIKELDELSSRDYLTGLRSRKYFYEEATPYIYKAHKTSTPCAVAMIDIDNFKQINDTYGHAVGDLVLKELSKILHNSLKGRDIVARYGGEEFVVLLRDTAHEDALIVFENLRAQIAQKSVFIVAVPEGINVQFTVSIGLNTRVEYALEKMLSKADFYLYEAKKSGKNCVVTQNIFEPQELV